MANTLPPRAWYGKDRAFRRSRRPAPGDGRFAAELGCSAHGGETAMPRYPGTCRPDAESVTRAVALESTAGWRSVSMVRRRSTVRFRKGAPGQGLVSHVELKTFLPWGAIGGQFRGEPQAWSLIGRRSAVWFREIPQVRPMFWLCRAARRDRWGAVRGPGLRASATAVCERRSRTPRDRSLDSSVMSMQTALVTGIVAWSVELVVRGDSRVCHSGEGVAASCYSGRAAGMRTGIGTPRDLDRWEDGGHEGSCP
jgi:hypothetical protein